MTKIFRDRRLPNKTLTDAPNSRLEDEVYQLKLVTDLVIHGADYTYSKMKYEQFLDHLNVG